MTNNQKLINWVNEWAELCQPEKVYWCDGSEEENQRLLSEMVASGMAVKLNDKKRPGSYYFQSDPSDVARLKTGHTSAPRRKKMPARPTTGLIRQR